MAVLSVGQKFFSYNELCKSMKEYENNNFVKFFKRSSTKINYQSVKHQYRNFNKELIYNTIAYRCIRGGAFRKKGEGKRITSTFKMDCPAIIILKANLDRTFLEVKSMEITHNHEISKEEYERLPQVRKLSKETIAKVEELLKVKGDKKLIQQKIIKETGKIVTLKDLSNINQRLKNSSNETVEAVAVLQEEYIMEEEGKEMSPNDNNSLCTVSRPGEILEQRLNANSFPNKRVKLYGNSSAAGTSYATHSSHNDNDCLSRSTQDNESDIRLEYSCSEEELKDNDANYFRCYADLSIHRVMIGDYSRTQTYRRAILTNYKMFHQKVVLDVGAGTGILSLFCAQAGAKKVYAIEASSIAKAAQSVVASNGFSDKIIVMQEKMEDVVLPEKVDIIVSEWMGYMLMYESMLPSLLHARDRWLKDGGLLFPEEVRIYIAPITDHQQYDYSVGYWYKTKDDYKVDMSVLAQLAAEQMRSSVHVMSVNPTAILSHASCVTVLELSKIQQSVSDCTQGSFQCNCFVKAVVHGFVIWFTVHFPNNIVLTTSPYARETHWEQSVLYIAPEVVEQDTAIDGKLSIKRGAVYRRFLDIDLEYQINNGEKKVMKFKMKD